MPGRGRPSVTACATPGCPELSDHQSGLCDDCRSTMQRRADARRPSSAKRGYGAAHQRLRASWAPRVAAGTVMCARCGFVIAAGAEWDLGHDDTDRRRYSGPEHTRCNRATKAH